MPKETNIEYNYLNTNTLPSMGGGKDTEDTPINLYIIKLVSRLLDMADEGYDILTPIDKETLRDVLACGSIEKLAKKQHKSDKTIRTRAMKAVDTLARQVRVWQEPHRKFVALNQRVHDLEVALEAQKKIVANLSAKYDQLEEENLKLMGQNGRQRSFAAPDLATQKSSGLTLVDEATTNLLNRKLEGIWIPSNITAKLNAHNIYTVYDLIRYRESVLARINGIGYSDMNKILRCLYRVDLHLGTDVRWVEALEAYYIKKNN